MLEAIFAIFVLLMGVIVVSTLLNRSSRFAVNEVRMAEQQAFAEKVMDEVRAWALDPDNFGSDWSYWNGRTQTSSEDSTIEATVYCEGTGLALTSPCSHLEANWPGRERVLPRAVMPVEVTATSPGLPPLNLVSYLPEAPRPLGLAPELQVNLSSGSLPLARAAEATFEAVLLDGSGEPISNVTFEWFLLPETGNAALLLSTAPRNGHQVTLRNELTMAGGTLGYASGTVRLRVISRYFGRLIDNGDPPVPSVELQ